MIRRVALVLTAATVFGTGNAWAQQAELSPKPGAKDICPDTPLRITYPQTPSIQTFGTIEIHDAADDSLAGTVNFNDASPTQTIGGLPNYVYHNAAVSGKTLTLYFPNHSLKWNKTYYVKVPAGLIAGDPIPDNKTAWRFSTKASPLSESPRFTVAADGTGDFATVQAALDFIPERNAIPRTIFIKPGTYEEILCLMNRDHITILGEDRKSTILQYANNDKFNPNAGGNPFGPGAPQPGAADPKKDAVYRRGVFLAHNCKDLTIANLTLRNTTPHGGSQAETIIFNGSPTDAHFILTNVDLYSFQDTLQVNGQAYINDASIEGDIDFMWGTGPCFFQSIHARAVTNGAVFTTVRCPPTHHGFVFKDSTFDGAPGITNSTLARIEANRFPTSETILLNTTMSNVITPAGWRAPTGGDASKIHFWELNSHDADGKSVDVTRRVPPSRQLREAEDKEAIAQYSDPGYVLGGWKPTLAPLLPRVPEVKREGEKVILTAVAVGIPAPRFQWSKDGVAIGGAEASSLAIQQDDLGKYTVIAINAAGAATSEPVEVKRD
ncbi:MAG TPA: pectinesterase family protein [Phycisphaerae bacterium]|nr:pectinesterase family protein [Phycisphaerae bacterium]